MLFERHRYMQMPATLLHAHVFAHLFYILAWLMIFSLFSPLLAAMVLFAQLRGRIGAAGLLLGKFQPGSSLHQAQSEVQANALLSSLESQSNQLTTDEKARLATMMAASAFAEKDTLAILSHLKGKSSNRRSAQDMTAYPYYLSASQWEAAKCNVEAVIGVSIDVIVHRLGGVNVNEHTLKRVASVALALPSTPNAFLGWDVKSATLLQVKAVYRRVVRGVKDMQKTKPSAIPYIVKLPSNPAELEQTHPNAGFKIEGCWTEPIVRMQEVYVMDTTYGCRNQPRQQDSMQQPLMQCVLALKDIMCSGQRRDDAIDIRYLDQGSQSSSKRSLRDLVAGMNPKKIRRSLDDVAPQLMDEVAPQIQLVSQQAEPPQIQLAPQIQSAQVVPIISGPSLSEAAVSSPTAAATPAASQVSESDVQTGDASTLRPTMGNRLLDVMVERDREKAKERADKQKAAKKTASVAEVPESAATPKQKKPCAKAAVGSGIKKPCAKAAVDSGIKKPKQQKPCASHEASRNQWLARSTFDGSKSFRYGVDKWGEKYEFTTESKAHAAAKAWLAKQRV